MESVGSIIRAQIGAAAIAELNAHSFFTGDRGALSFKIKGSRVCGVKVVYDEGRDSYNVEFFGYQDREARIGVSSIAKESDVYAEDLARILVETVRLYDAA